MANRSLGFATPPINRVAKFCGSPGVRVSRLEMDGRKSGVVKNDSFRIMREDTLCENCSTCLQM